MHRAASSPRRVAALAVVVSVAVLSGCASPDGSGAASRDHDTAPRSHDAVDCRSEGGLLDPAADPHHRGESASEPIPVPIALPADFMPAAALSCNFELVGDMSGPLELQVTVTRLEGDFALLLAALAEPDGLAEPNTVCDFSMEHRRPLWLESVDGALISVRIPLDACGKTKPGTRGALAALEAISVEEWPTP